jgi:hypothetical protein
MDFTQKTCLRPAESESVGIFEISLPVLELYTNTFKHFLTVHLTVRDFFAKKKMFFDIKISKIWSRQASFVLLFSPESCGPCLCCYDKCKIYFYSPHIMILLFWLFSLVLPLISPLVPRWHICSAYIDKFVENWDLKISQFCFLGIVHLSIGLNFRQSEVWKL